LSQLASPAKLNKNAMNNLVEGVAKVFASDCVLTSVAIIDGLLAGIERVRCAKHSESCARIDCKLILPVTERGRNLAP
jgi:hypothetical protein